MTPIEPGRTLLGKYRVDGEIGRGGMGAVLRAEHVELGVPVAIKVLHGAAVTAPDVAARFLREAQAASRLRSEFVARVTDYGRLDDGSPCMVMELLHGEDFQAILARGPLPIAEAADAVAQAAAALAEAHAAGVVHRDLKPSNLFRTTRPDGSACTKVLDFGISKVMAPLPDQPVTDTGHVLGTPLYMSPEQVRAPKEIDERTDVWSLGVVLYEMLAGEPPFRGDTLGVVFARILETEPRALRDLRPEAPEALCAAVQRCLEKDRDRRPATMRDLAALLAPFASSEGAVAARRAGIAPAPGAAARASSPDAEPTPRPASPLASSDTQALAETLDAAAIASEKDGEPTAVPAATQEPPPDRPPRAQGLSARDAGDGGASAVPAATARRRLPLSLAVIALAAVLVAVAAAGMRSGTPPISAASGAPPAASSLLAGSPATASAPGEPARAHDPSISAATTATAAPTVTPAPEPAGVAPGGDASSTAAPPGASSGLAAPATSSGAAPVASSRASASASGGAPHSPVPPTTGRTSPQPQPPTLW